MKALLDSAKSKLGFKKDTLAESRGQTLGGGSDSSEIFDVTFTDAELGITILAAPDGHIMNGSPIVVEVTPRSAASAGGVRVGDVIVSIESNSGFVSYGDFVEIVGALGRPLTLRFQRIAAQTQGAKQLGTDKSHSSLSEEELEARRVAMREAAVGREKAWDKRVNSAASSRRRKVCTLDQYPLIYSHPLPFPRLPPWR